MTPCRTLLAVLLLCGSAATSADDKSADKPNSSCAAAVDSFFLTELWAKVATQSCLTCHKTGGDAEESQFVLRDPARSQGAEREATLRHNCATFARIAKLKDGDKYRILLKIAGGLNHGGEAVLKPDSAGYRIVEEFVRRVNAPHLDKPASLLAKNPDQAPFFAGIVMLDDRRLLRRATLSLAGRLPTAAEFAAVEAQGPAALPAILDELMKEEGFYTRLREGFNDIFLTVGYDDGAESALAYDHFSKTRIWNQTHDLSHIGDEKKRQQARYKLADDYRAALLGEPMKLIEHIVRNDRPFTEIVTADYILVTPYTARGYGIFDELKDKFQNSDDPFEYMPVRLKALKGRDRNQDQPSETGFYPHAGMLSVFQYLRRYPTTETNRNRLRARMYYQHFLGIDALELAARVSDAAAVTAKFEIPTMQASECVVCHKTIDPVAGLFQDYYKFEGVYGRRKEGWYTDMFAAGFEGEEMPADQRWRSLQWLGERTAKDPRFAAAMVEHVYYILTGRKVLLPPKDLEHSLFAFKQRAYSEQRRQIEQIAQRFAAEGFNLKTAFKQWIASEFYRADGLSTAAENPEREAELDDIGLVRLLAPEQIERKVAAVFGQRWGKLNDQLAVLYGGIDSQEVTERPADPSGAMGAIQRMFSNEIAARDTLRDFTKPPTDRRFFASVEPNDLPGASPETDAKIRATIVHLHERILGQRESSASPDVERTYKLFAAIVSAAKGQKGFEKVEIYHARRNLPDAPADPHYTIRAWRGVITYLLRRPEFIYE